MKAEILRKENDRLREEGIEIYMFDDKYIYGFVAIVIREKELKDTSLSKIIDNGYEPIGAYPKKQNSFMFIIDEHKLEKIHSEESEWTPKPLDYIVAFNL